ncbi:MAG: hypothetical protein Q9169_008720, partial [Polycauliona sp. 2 TL-2023]
AFQAMSNIFGNDVSAIATSTAWNQGNEYTNSQHQLSLPPVPAASPRIEGQGNVGAVFDWNNTELPAELTMLFRAQVEHDRMERERDREEEAAKEAYAADEARRQADAAAAARAAALLPARIWQARSGVFRGNPRGQAARQNHLEALLMEQRRMNGF